MSRRGRMSGIRRRQSSPKFFYKQEAKPGDCRQGEHCQGIEHIHRWAVDGQTVVDDGLGPQPEENNVDRHEDHDGESGSVKVFNFHG